MTDYDRGFEDGAEAVQRQVDEQRLSRYEPAYVEELEAQLARLREDRDTLLAVLRAAEKVGFGQRAIAEAGDAATALRRMQRAISEVEGEK